MSKAVEFRYDNASINGVSPLTNFRDMEGLVYNSDGSFRARSEAEDRVFLKTLSTENERLIALIKQVPDDKLHQYGLACANSVIDPKDPLVTRSSRKSSAYDSKGFPVDGPAYMVWINAPRTIKGKVYTSEWFDGHERIIREIIALNSSRG